MTHSKHALKTETCQPNLDQTESGQTGSDLDTAATFALTSGVSVANDTAPVVVKGQVQPSQITPVLLSPSTGFRFQVPEARPLLSTSDGILAQSNALSRIGAIVSRIQTVKTQILEN